MRGRQRERRTHWRIRSVSLSSIFSTALVLFALGILALLLINVDRISSYVRENLSMSLVLQDRVKQVDADFLRRNLESYDFIKSTAYISKEKAAEEFTQSLGQDFLSVLAYNPLSASIELKLNAGWTSADSIAKIAAQMQALPQVSEVHYEASLVELVNENTKKISALILSFSLVMSFIALVLINNTMRLSIYANRFNIKTMQLVGATRSFARRPFMRKAVIHGVWSSLIAIALILVGVWFVQDEFYELVNLGQYPVLIAIAVFVLLAGIAINCITTFFSVNTFFDSKIDDLYY